MSEKFQMLSKYYPSAYVEDVFSIEYEKLYRMGYRGLIFDIDNTLVAHGKDGTPQTDILFNKLQDMGFKTFLLSNNNEARILRFRRNNDTPYLAEAGKPSPAPFFKAMEMMGTPKEATLVVGDSVFTDILGANKASLSSILVKYIGYYKKEWKGFRRYLENAILIMYRINRRRNGSLL